MVIGRARLERTERSLPVTLLWFAVVMVGLLLAGLVAIVGDGPSGIALLIMLPLGALLVRGSPGLLAIITALGLAGPTLTVAQFGDFDARVWDFAYVMLLGWVLVAPRNRRQHGHWLAPLMFFACTPLVLVAVRTLFGLDVEPGAWVSAARFAQTFSLAWIAARAIADARDVRLVISVLIIVSSIVMLIGVAFAGSLESAVQERSTGPFGLNTFGLIAGLLILSYFWEPQRRSWLVRAFPAVLGVAGLILAKSLGAFLATAIAVPVAIYLTSSLPDRSRAQRAIFGAAVGIMALAATISLFQIARPESLPGTEGFQEGSSPSIRYHLGSAAFQLFQEEPIAGNGWLSSSNWSMLSSQEALQDPDSTPVRLQVFSGQFAPSAHSAYLQILAELGLVGALVLAWCVVRLWVLCRFALASPDRVVLTYPVVALLFMAVWWNASSLYGSQTESMISAIMIGAIAALTPARATANEPRGGVATPEAELFSSRP